jgi:hypothetical protein
MKLSNLPPGVTDMDIERAAGFRTKSSKKPSVSRSGRKFTSRGVKQKIKVGVLLRSIGYGSRIVEVMGKYKDRWVVRHFCNTAHYLVINEYVLEHRGKSAANDPRNMIMTDIKGNRHRDTVGHEYLTYPYGWQVVKEITK